MNREISQKPVVFCILQDSRCAECGGVVEKNQFLRLQEGRALCLRCAHLDHLVFLPSGDAALTSRATKRSARSAVVLRFSRARKRCERQGVLVEEAALAAAEEECSRDAADRAVRREKSAARRVAQDRVLVVQMMETIRELFPRCPSEEVEKIAERTTERGSGRVGRSAGGRALDPEAVTLAVVAAVRHGHTNYEELLANGWERAEAREQVRAAAEKVLDEWRLPV
jgi:hypothetical protein